MESQPPKSRKADIIVLELDGEILIYDLKVNKAFSLNETSALIWQMCDGKKSLSEISRSLGENLNAAVDDGLVWLALEQLREADLLERTAALPDSLAGLSRRQAIRQVGLAAAIALPLISSLVAPLPIHAASTPRSPVPPPISLPMLGPIGPPPSVIVGRGRKS